MSLVLNVTLRCRKKTRPILSDPRQIEDTRKDECSPVPALREKLSFHLKLYPYKWCNIKKLKADFFERNLNDGKMFP